MLLVPTLGLGEGEQNRPLLPCPARGEVTVDLGLSPFVGEEPPPPPDVGSVRFLPGRCACHPSILTAEACGPGRTSPVSFSGRGVH